MIFSIVVPLYNKVKSVRRTISSILKQSYPHFELIVVDDGSTDGSREVVETINDDRLTIITQQNSGVSAARNQGILSSNNSHVVFVDADDTLEADYLLHMLELISTYPEAGAFCTRYQYVSHRGTKPCNIYRMKNRPSLFHNYFEIAANGDLPLVASGICIPKLALEWVGGFPTNQKQGEDQDLWSRIGLEYSIAVHPSFDVNYHLDAENRVSRQVIPEAELPYSKTLQAKLDRNQIAKPLISGVKRYIASHLLHLVELNLNIRRLSTAEKILNDPRTIVCKLRWLKWQTLLMYRKLKNSSNKYLSHSNKIRVHNLLNDKKMGGISSSIKGLSSSNIGNTCEFQFQIVEPTSLIRGNYQSDIVLTHYASSWQTILPNLLTKLLNPRAKMILQEHHYTHSFFQQVPSKLRFKWMLKLNYWVFDKVVAVSHGQANWLRSLSILEEDKLEAIPQCRKLEQFFEVKQKKETEHTVIAAYGRLCEAKGFDTLIKAFIKVKEPSLTLRIAGDGPLMKELKALAKKDSRVEFVGRIDDIPKFLAGSDLVLIPSRSEAFGLVCLESKAAGKAVIASDIDGLSEQVVEPEDDSVLPACGMKIKYHSVAALASLIHRVPKMPLSEWGKNGRFLVRHAWDRYQSQWSQLLS